MRILWLLTLIFVYSEASLAAQSARAIYEVPVEDVELKPYARYPIAMVSDDYYSLPKTISYQLPAPLTGAPYLIQMERDPQNYEVYRGQNVVGICKKMGRELMCRLSFSNLKIDPLKVESSIQQTYPNSNEQKARLAVAKIFSTEPIGILRYRLRGRDR